MRSDPAATGRDDRGTGLRAGAAGGSEPAPAGAGPGPASRRQRRTTAGHGWRLRLEGLRQSERKVPWVWPAAARRLPLEPLRAPVRWLRPGPRGSRPPALVGRPRGEGLRALLRGAAQSLAVVALFVGLGLVAATVRLPDPPAPSYARAAMPGSDPLRERGLLWLVDGFNLLHVGLLRGQAREAARHDWWGPRGRQQVLEHAGRFQGPVERLVVVFDGPRPPPPPGPGSPEVVFAPSADSWLLAQVREAVDPGRVVVVTADRRLAARSRARGAQVVSPSAFLARCTPGPPAAGAEPKAPEGGSI